MIPRLKLCAHSHIDQFLGDGDQRQAQAMSSHRFPRGIQPPEAAQRLGAILGRDAGAVVGAVLLYLLPLFLAPLIGHHHALVFGVVMLGVILFQPRGLIGVYDRARALLAAKKTA